MSTQVATFAESVHAGQTRGDGTPFIEHPREVALLLSDSGAPDHLIAAGLLHDVLEKTSIGEPELRWRFGTRVAALVSALTEDARIKPAADRQAELRERVAGASDEVLTVFAADKISKVRELSGARPATRSARAQLRHYRECLQIVERRLPDSPLVAQLRAELADHEASPERPRAHARAVEVWGDPAPVPHS